MLTLYLKNKLKSTSTPLVTSKLIKPIYRRHAIILESYSKVPREGVYNLFLFFNQHRFRYFTLTIRRYDFFGDNFFQISITNITNLRRFKSKIRFWQTHLTRKTRGLTQAKFIPIIGSTIFVFLAAKPQTEKLINLTKASKFFGIGWASSLKNR